MADLDLVGILLDNVCCCLKIGKTGVDQDNGVDLMMAMLNHSGDFDGVDDASHGCDDGYDDGDDYLYLHHLNGFYCCVGVGDVVGDSCYWQPRLECYDGVKWILSLETSLVNGDDGFYDDIDLKLMMERLLWQIIHLVEEEKEMYYSSLVQTDLTGIQ